MNLVQTGGGGCVGRRGACLENPTLPGYYYFHSSRCLTRPPHEVVRRTKTCLAHVLSERYNCKLPRKILDNVARGNKRFLLCYCPDFYKISFDYPAVLSVHDRRPKCSIDANIHKKIPIKTGFMTVCNGIVNGSIEPILSSTP